MNISKNSSGFAIWEVLIVFVLLLFVGLAGWKVLQHDAKEAASSPSGNETQADRKPASKKSSDLKSYEDEIVSLKHPNGWTVQRYDNESLAGTKQLFIASSPARPPVDREWRYDDEFYRDNKGVYENKYPSLIITVFFYSNELKPGTDCPPCGNVLAEPVNLNNPTIPNAKLLFTEGSTPSSNHDSKPDTMIVATNENMRIGDKGFGIVEAGGKTLNISIGFGYKITTPGVVPYSSFESNFTSIEALKATSQYKEMLEVLNSLVIK